jgi:hypothetical protein
MAASIVATPIDVDDADAAGLHAMPQRRRIDRRYSDTVEAEHVGLPLAGDAGVRQQIDRHGVRIPAHLFHPVRSHHGTHAVAVHEHDTRAPRGGVAIGFLHELTAGHAFHPREVGRGIFVRIAHVEDVQGAPGRLGAPFFQRRLVDPIDAEALRDAIRCRTCSGVARR